MKNEITIHCSGSSWGNAAEITKWHVIDNGWSAIGYHFIILNGKIHPNYFHNSLNGLVETGRPINMQGAHTKGHNDTIGICLIGKSGEFTDNQIIALKNQVNNIKNIVGPCVVKQHSDYDPENKPFCAGLPAKLMLELNL